MTRVRRRLTPPLDRVEPILGSKDWVPAHTQIAVTEAIVDEFLDGDLRALYPLLVEDTRAGVGRVNLALLRTLGAARAFALGRRELEVPLQVGHGAQSTAQLSEALTTTAQDQYSLVERFNR